MIAEISWRNCERVSSIAELDKVLDRIAQEVPSEMPAAILVFRRNGDCLSIVLGSKEVSVVSFWRESKEPPYFESVGDLLAPGEFTFIVDETHRSEALGRAIITLEAARETVRQFVVLDEGLPNNI